MQRGALDSSSEALRSKSGSRFTRDSENGREYWVKFVGYGEEKNLWYWEDDLLQTTPEMVAEYEEELERRAKKKINERAPGKRVPGKREGSRRKRSVG